MNDVTPLSSNINLNTIYETQLLLLQKMATIEDKLKTREELWISISEIARVKELSKDAVRKQLKNGSFEEGADFKYLEGKILVHQGAIERIRRRRRNSNG
jgi:hypothetical protein